MEYVVGSVAALISGNVTPNRPKIVKRALTPMKHQQSPNVTPKSELVSDRSIFLSPTAQKKKAIVKKSPKRIFQNPDLDETNESEGNSTLLSPQADKVKKHLKDDLDANVDKSSIILSPKSPKNKLSKPEEPSSPKKSPKKKLSLESNATEPVIQVSNERTPKKKKKKHSLSNDLANNDNSDKSTVETKNIFDSNMEVDISEEGTPKKQNKSGKLASAQINATESHDTKTNVEESGIQAVVKVNKNKKRKKKSANPVPSTTETVESSVNNSTNMLSPSGNKENEEQKKKKKNKKRKKNTNKNQLTDTESSEINVNSEETEKSETVNKTPFINPNAITNQDTDSEHESDDDIESENEESNKAVLDTGPEESSDEEEEKPKEKKKADKEEVKERPETEEEVKRTLFVGNVPFSSKCKKEIKRIFSKYGDIDTIRIRTVPVKDARVTPKLAVIKNEIHPDRSTVNVYIKYKQTYSVLDALVENNTVLHDHHLRVARSDVTGSEHDPKCSVFVGNIPFGLEDEGLRAKFEKCGEIESVRIIRDRKTNAGKGFGYVNFASKDGVELALALTDEDLTIKNRIMRVKRCTQATTNKDRQQSQGRNGNQKQNYQPRFNQGRPNQRNDRGQVNRFNDRGQVNRFGKQFGNDRFQRGQNEDSKGEGAYRRILNKRKPLDNNEGPPNKRPKNLNQPNKEKKPRKEFVGMTTEKKKFQKKKLNKDQKKKRAFSEILTKQRQ